MHQLQINSMTSSERQQQQQRESRQEDMEWHGHEEQLEKLTLRGPKDEDGDALIEVQDEVDIGEAMRQIYAYGAPAAIVFSAIAYCLWLRLGDLQAEMMLEQTVACD